MRLELIFFLWDTWTEKRERYVFGHACIIIGVFLFCVHFCGRLQYIPGGRGEHTYPPFFSFDISDCSINQDEEGNRAHLAGSFPPLIFSRKQKSPTGCETRLWSQILRQARNRRTLQQRIGLQLSIYTGGKLEKKKHIGSSVFLRWRMEERALPTRGMDFLGSGEQGIAWSPA